METEKTVINRFLGRCAARAAQMANAENRPATDADLRRAIDLVLDEMDGISQALDATLAEVLDLAEPQEDTRSAIQEVANIAADNGATAAYLLTRHRLAITLPHGLPPIQPAEPTALILLWPETIPDAPQMQIIYPISYC